MIVLLMRVNNTHDMKNEEVVGNCIKLGEEIVDEEIVKVHGEDNSLCVQPREEVIKCAKFLEQKSVSSFEENSKEIEDNKECVCIQLSKLVGTNNV